ncbi:MAG: 3-dehydroquinate synthase [Desulfobacterales bacterium]|jgi:3-dehydroquinate synthase
MKKLTIKGQSKDSILLIGEHLKNADRYISGDRTVVITDTNVRSHFHKDFPAGEIISIGPGEVIKNLDTVKTLYGKLVELSADRSTFVIGIGGGVVCDICGFVASTYMRGMRFAYIPTTLLAQVDASVGGKTGVNLGGYKNLVGVFNQPEFVLCDFGLLKTLPVAEMRSGFAEIVKHAVIADEQLFDFLEQNFNEAIELDPAVIEKLVYESLVIKSTIVNADERETGKRRKLNFGHTFGHAIEKATGVNHGEAVSAGMVMASALSVEKGFLKETEHHRLKTLLEKIGLPTRLRVNMESVLDALGKDKKREGEAIHFVLLNAIGKAMIVEMFLNEIKESIQRGLLTAISEK